MTSNIRQQQQKKNAKNIEWISALNCKVLKSSLTFQNLHGLILIPHFDELRTILNWSFLRYTFKHPNRNLFHILGNISDNVNQYSWSDYHVVYQQILIINESGAKFFLLFYFCMFNWLHSSQPTHSFRLNFMSLNNTFSQRMNAIWNPCVAKRYFSS